jgi:hypothetical protein
MKTSLHAVIAAFVIGAIPTALWAQWPSHPTPNVPKLADGKPNMEGPTPRIAGGKPDLSGIWQFEGNRTPRPPADPGVIAGSGPAASLIPPGYGEFFDIGSTVQGGLPFTPWAAALRKQRKEKNAKDNPDAHCLPLGLMQLHTHPQPRKMIQMPGLIVILYEAQGGVRQIFMDGRPLPNNDPQPWWYGYSIGHWDGDTLVVESTGFRDDVWLDVEGSPLTSTGRMTERFRRVNFGHLQIEVTVEDPKSYTRPWTVQINQRLLLNTELIEFICNENEKSDAHLVGN